MKMCTKALFLDRDGVINEEIDYLYRAEDFRFIDGIFDVCRFFRQAGFDIFVITNQAGIARGYYSEQDFWQLTEWMVKQFGMKGIEIRKVYFCPYHETAGVGKYKRASFDRKPNPGMLLKARDEFGVDLAASVLIGDKESDIEAGLNAGVGATVLLRGHKVGSQSTKAHHDIPDLQAIPHILNLQ